MNFSIKNSIPIIIILFFIMPPSITPFIPEGGIRTTYYYLVLGFYWIISILFLKPIFLKKDYSFSTSFTLILMIMAILSFLVKGELSFFNLIFPISALAMYRVCLNYKANNGQYIFIFYFLFLYFIHYINYFSIIPDLFYRPFFNEDMLYGASSNAIPLSLNNSLMAFMVLNLLYKWNCKKVILSISSINLILCMIQQGRSGTISAIILFFIAIYEFSPRFYLKNKIKFNLLSIITLLITVISLINIYQIGQNENYSFLQEKRVLAQLSFLQQLSSNNFIFGYPEGTYFAYETYTFNMFLDFWNKYNFFTMFFLIFFVCYRLIQWKYFLMPRYYFLPFFLYALFESIYLPGFWDFYVYILLFTPSNHKF